MQLLGPLHHLHRQFHQRLPGSTLWQPFYQHPRLCGKLPGKFTCTFQTITLAHDLFGELDIAGTIEFTPDEGA